MTLAEYVQNYMNEHDLSQRQLAEKCGLSHNYIHFIVRGNPKTGRPITPTLDKFQKLADGMNTTIENLFASLDDMPVLLSDKKLSEIEPDKLKMISFFEDLTEENRANALQYLEFLKGQQK